jgi:excisionase family DNA binding protein
MLFIMEGGSMNNVKDNYKLMFTTYPDVVTVRELKDMLGIGITLAYRLVKSNNIKSLKIGREYKIPKANVISYLTTNN